ncbi:two-component regulator propeller domain-containing protein [Cytophaga aurantiaca]|uniref:two-component regulator propeller domain-containing protein n=1 Tax=Cytophaga aurantiaca TaxID=29530 RepID=UPI00047601D4|nr:two-component regulator propeller domain-containing protein [Cytophaga aurantiaca]
MASFFVHAQSGKMNFRFLSAKDGFYPDKVRQIAQDTEGVLWLATNEGLITYDGIRFRAIQEQQKKNAPKGADIICLFADINGDVWIGTNKGLALYTKRSDSFTQIAFPGTTDVYVVSVCKDSKGTLWVGTDAGVFKISSNTQAVPFLKVNPFNGTLPFVRIDSTGNVVVVTHNSIYRYNSNTAISVDSVTYIQQKFLSDNYHTAVELDAANTIWIGKYNGEVYKYSLGSKNVIRFDMKGITKNTSAIINYFDVRDPAKVWLAVDESGLYYYDLQNQKFVAAITPQNAELPTYKINTVFIDREGSTWLAMSKNGLALTNGYLNTFGKIIPPADKSQIVSAVLKDLRGNIWVGTDGAGIYVYNSSGDLQKHFYYNPTQPSSLSNDAILCMYLDSQNRIWIGSFRGGLSLYQPSTQTFKHYQYHEGDSTGLLRNDIRSIAEDAAGNLWLAVHGKGVSKFDPQTGKIINYPYLSSSWTTKVLVDHQGTVWASSNNGLSRLRKDDVTFVDINTEKQLTELQDHDINCMFEDHQKRLWVGTVNGLYLINTKTDQLIEAPRVKQLGIASIKSIQQDSRGVLYVSTNRGLYKYIPAIGECGRYGIEDGLPGEDFVINASLKTDSVLYFGTSKGLCWFNPKGIDIESILVKPIITELVVNDVPYDAAIPLSNGNIELDYQQNHVLFQIASPTYKWGDEKFDVEFMLEGLDKTWQKLGKNKSVNYPAIPPGNYTFKSRLRISGTEIVGPEYSFQVFIHPPFWETWWFRILLLLIGITAVYAYNKIKTLRIEKQNVFLEEKITERTHELTVQKELLEKQHQQLELANATKDKLFSVIAHDLRSPFTSISSLAQLLYHSESDQTEADKKTMTGYILKASKNALNVVENLLDWSRTQRGRIQFNPLEVNLNQSIVHVIQGFEFQLIDKNIQLRFHAPTVVIGVVDKDMFETILRNLIANAIKFTPSEGNITITLQPTEKSFNIIIQDSGVGMNTETLKKISAATFHNSQSGTSGERGTGLGLELVQEFLAYHEATWEFVSEKNNGTEVQLHFNSPYSIQNESAADKFFGIAALDVLHNTAAPEPVFENRMDAIKGKTILVVDDQEDIRKSIVYTLRDYFVILEAENGQQALEIARAEMPDLILSDVVMPDMDGLELSAQLKSSVQTSHIPIILLTSQKEEASIISGLNTGVEDYLLKPFHPQILLLKIGNLLQNRESLKMKLSLDEAYLLKPISENSLDKIWLTKIHDLIEEQLSNEDFNVELLSKEMNMHRSNFSKKLTALTGYTPTDLIRMQRMKRAAKLILASGKNISEIAFEVGFSDPKYFSKSFKAHFGVSPSDYGKTPD